MTADTQTSQTPVVLIVDDEPVVTQSLRSFLELETDYEIHTFESPLEALRLAQEQPIDVVVADFLMPAMNGLEFLSRIKELYPDVPRILLTGYADKENSIQAINEVGLFQYMEKPWDNDQLKLILQNAISNRSLRQSLTQRIRELDALLLERDRLQERDERLREELSVARRLQRSLLPQVFPNDRGVTFSAQYLPALEVGGDFYDVIPLAGDRLGVLIADATGHGIQAALSTAVLKFAFSQFMNCDSSPADIVRGMNRVLLTGLPEETYVAAQVLVVDTKEARCQLVNAGLPHPFVLRRKQRKAERVVVNGFVLGAIDDDLYQIDEEKAIDLGPGDTLFLYTDGISEVENGKGELFDKTMLREELQANLESDSDGLSARLVDASKTFSRPEHEWDDVTIVTIDRR